MLAHEVQDTRPPCPSPTLGVHPNSWSLLKLTSIKLVMPSNHLILCHPLLLLPLIFLSIRIFSNESTLHIRWPNYWSFGFSISLYKKHSGLISFRIDWLYLLAVQGTLKSLLQPQLKSINSLALSLLYGPTLTSIQLIFLSIKYFPDLVPCDESGQVPQFPGQ